MVITFNPDEGLPGRLELLRKQVAQVIVIDNGSARLGVLPREVQVEPNPVNLGIAKALDQGLGLAREGGAGWVLTLDQDSLPAPDMLEQMLHARGRLHQPERVAIIAPVINDPGRIGASLFVRRVAPGLFRRTRCEGELLDGVTAVITSGSLVNLEAYKHIGCFREDFFIDYVDTEYCLRAQARGYRIVVACKAVMHHRLGARRRSRLAGIVFSPTFHSPSRWYYISRNRVPMIRMYGFRFPHWLFYEMVASSYGILRMLVTEDQRCLKLRAFARGTLDGLRGRMGPIRPELAAQLERRGS